MVEATQLVQCFKYLSTALCLIPFIAVAKGVSEIFIKAIDAVGRNPESRDKIFPIAILGFAMTEAVALFALIVAVLILFS